MKTLVLGMGNPILSDDGVGIRVAQELEKKLADPEVTVGEAALGGLALLDLIPGYDRVIIIDAIQTEGGKPGTLYRLGVDDFAFARHLSSPHDMNFVTALELGAMLGMAIPPKITIFAVEVEDVITVSEECTPEVRQAIPACVQTVLRELKGDPATIKDEEAEVVRTAYRWPLDEQLSVRRIARRLTELDVSAPGGGSVWRSSTVGRLLTSEIYAGTGYYNKRQKAVPQRYRVSKAYRKDAKSSFRSRPRDEWLPFAAPAIVDRETWERTQAQLRQNALRSPRNNKRFQYFLKGLVRCGSCGRPLTGQSQNGHSYYRHNRGETLLMQESCPQSRGYRREILETLVWEAVSGALREPALLVQEYERRFSEATTQGSVEAEQKQIGLALKRLKNQEDRAY